MLGARLGKLRQTLLSARQFLQKGLEAVLSTTCDAGDSADL
jgi:hypothetical protein